MNENSALQVTAAARVLQPLAVVLNQRGIDASAFLNSHGIDYEQLNDPLARVPEPVVREIWLDAVKVTCDDALALKVGRRADPLAFGVVGYVLSNAATVAQAFQLLERFNRLVFDAILLYPERDAQGRGILHFRRDPEADPEANRPMVEYLMTALLRLAGFLVGGEDLGPKYLQKLTFRHRAPDSQVIAVYRQGFGDVEIEFGSYETSITFGRDFLDLPVAYADPQLLELMKNQADRQLRALAMEGDIVMRVRECIRRRLLGKAPAVVDVAADCGISRATLQRRLQESGTSFQELLDEVRFAAAREFLDATDNSLNEIAFMLGYAEVSAFHHAFRRWAGKTPGQYRTQ